MLMLFLPEERIFSDPAGIDGYLRTNGDPFLIVGENDQLKKIVSSSADSYEVQTYVARKGLDVLFPEDSPDSLLYYYTTVNVKKWYVRLVLKILLTAGLKRCIYAFLAPRRVAIVFKKGDSTT